MVLIGCSNLQKREELNQQTKVEMQKFIIGKWEGIYESYYTFNNERLNIEVLKFYFTFKEDGTLVFEDTDEKGNRRVRESKYYFADKDTIITPLFEENLVVYKKSEDIIKFHPQKDDPNDPDRISIAIVYLCDYKKINEK
jgi:hypothetical protein